MLTLGMTAGADNTAIWVVKIELDSSTLRYGTKAITLSSNLYSGDKIQLKEDFSTKLAPQSINLINNRGLTSIQTFSFSIANWNSTFIDDFFPTTSAPYLSGRKVSFGLVWTGATAESEITWLFEGYIYEYAYSPNALDITCLEYSDFENIIVPFYKVQKDTDDGISYFTKAPDESYGRPIPIVYGSFNIVSFDYFLYCLAPTICTNLETLQYVTAWHKCFLDVSDLNGDLVGEYTFNGKEVFRYVPNVQNFLIMRPSDGSIINAELGYGVTLWADKTKGDTILGAMVLPLPTLGSQSDYATIKDLFDADTTTAVVVEDTKQIAIKMGYDSGSNDIGLLGLSATDISLEVFWQSDDGDNRQLTLKYYNPSIASPTSTASAAETTTSTGGTFITTQFPIGNVTTNKIQAVLPWGFEELNNIEWLLQNTSGAGAVGGSINIGRAYLTLQNIVLARVLPRWDGTLSISFTIQRSF